MGDPTISCALEQRAGSIREAFAAIEPALRELARRQFDEHFGADASELLRARLGIELSASLFQVSWSAPLDVRRLYSHCVLATFCHLIEQRVDHQLARLFEGESAEELIRRWGFHAIDVTPCADGRLSGVVDFILRIPSSVVAFRESTAGALFEVEHSVRHWESVELRRWSQARPNAAAAATRFLKIGVYHFSSVDPQHEGCAAHGSDEVRAASALLERLEQLGQAIHITHGEQAGIATLLIGVDTDTDAIRVHVPDADGRLHIDRVVDNRDLYEATRDLPREQAKELIRQQVAGCMGVAADDRASEGIRWFCGYLLKNNLAQVDAVRSSHGGSYQDHGHGEQLMLVGDAVDDVQLRNLVFLAQMDTVEEGATDLDVGVKILRKLHEPRGLAVPILVHFRFDARIPGARARAEGRAQRLRKAIEARFDTLVSHGDLVVRAVVRARDGGAVFTVADAQPTPFSTHLGCHE